MAIMDPGAPTWRRKGKRRRQDKPAISARLVLDDHVKSDVGIISDDLFADLFPHLQAQPSQNGDDHMAPAPAPTVPDLLHVAIAPWAPSHGPDTTSWTIVPVTKSSALAHSTVQFSPSSLALQSFAANLKRVAPSKLSSHSRSGIEILVLDVAAIALDTVFVSLEGELAKRLEDGEGTFFRDHPVHINGNGKAKEALSPEDRLTAALRIALGTLKVVHDGDLFPLPLAPHPITHVPPNPGRVTLCEPVAQGILSPRTRIVVSRGRLHSKRDRDAPRMPVNRALNGVHEDDEDTANDQFYSAAEERYRTDVATEAAETATETEDSEDPGVEDEDEISDDSLDDMISLETPTLPATTASGVSTMQPGSPMTIGRGRKTNGISTPMSVFSSFTATTARPDRPRGRLFKAQGLAGPVPPELLHPKPAIEDDEEARVYVDTRDLIRVGCLSGDWVRMEVADEPPVNGLGAFGLGSFASPGEEEPSWRPVRVFGLPEGYSHRPVTRIPSSKHDGRRLSFFESQVQKPSSPAVYLSPILLANMESSPYLRLSPLKRASHPGKLMSSKLTAPMQPPFAREVVLQQVRTPVPVEREVQTAVMAGLKLYFEKKLRIIKSGDLLAVPIDSQLGRALQEASSSVGDESAVDQVLSLMASKKRSSQSPRYDEVAWFRVSHVQAMKSEVPEDAQDEEDTWGSVACVDTSTAHLEQTGSVTSRVPGTRNSTWQYYLGLKKASQKASTSRPTALVLEQDRYISPLRRKLRELVAAATSMRAIHLKMPPVAILLVSTHRNIGKATVAVEACRDIGLHTFSIDAYDILNESGAGGSDVKTEGFLMSRSERAMSCGPECCALLIRHIEALTADRMASSMREILADARVLIATTSEVDKVPDSVRGLFTHELDVGAPDEGEREGILRTIIDDRGLALDPDVDLSGVALKTAALVAGDLADVVERALVAQQSRLRTLSAQATSADTKVTVRDVQVAGGPAALGLTKADFEVAVDAARKNFADAIGAPKIPNVTWDDVGGLNNVKEAVRETIQLPLERPELFAKGMKKRSGILFYGPPGTGKTLLAKAIATEYSLNFFSVKGPELLNMYIGESEANVRRVFQRARDARPCVVFFDELDSVAPKRGNQGDSGGVMDRIVSQLLAELDGMSSGDDAAAGAGGVFVIGATNRPDLLDQALLRPGRFDKMLYLGVPDTHDKQLTIMEALTRKFTLHPTVSLRSVVQKLPFTYTGADFYALCSDAMLKAVTRQASHVDARIRALNASPPAPKALLPGPFESASAGPRQHHFPISTAYFFDHFATPDDLAVMVTEQDFLSAHAELVPSVSAGELAHYERVRATFEGGRDGGGSGANGQTPGQIPGAVGPGALNHGRRTASGQSKASSKGKGKAIALSAGSGGKDVKGKGKAIAIGSEDEVEDDGDEAYMTADVNGWGKGGIDKGKGKGKAVLSGGGFGEGGQSDDDGLYE